VLSGIILVSRSRKLGKGCSRERRTFTSSSSSAHRPSSACQPSPALITPNVVYRQVFRYITEMMRIETRETEGDGQQVCILTDKEKAALDLCK
jgi:hypothetical protein